MIKKTAIITGLMLFCFNSIALAITIPANVEIKFKTTVNVSTVNTFNENVGAVEMVFDMQEQLYKPIDSLPEDITGFSIRTIKISAPTLSGNENLTASIRMAFKETIQDTAIPLYSATNWSSNTLKNGASLSSESGLSSLNNTLLADIANVNSPRKFNNILFVIKIKLDGVDASAVNLNDLNLDLELTADVVTKAAL